MNKYLKYILMVCIISIVIGGAWFFVTYYEGELPHIALMKPLDRVGKKGVITVVFSDQKSGLRNTAITITQDGKARTLDAVEFPEKGTGQHTARVELDAEDLKLHDGIATFDIHAVDYSLRKNRNAMTVTVTVDTTPPQIFQVSSQHYINQGGSCITLYGIPEDVAKTYVYVNNDHFTSYPITIKEKPYYICYFALPVDAKAATTRIGIAAEDKAGNISMSSLSFHIRNKKFRSDGMYISKRFLERKIPEFRQMNPQVMGSSLIESFIYINETLRSHNLETIISTCKTSHTMQLWEGPFLRMTNAATMAMFGDRRTYYFDGKQVSKSIHLGVDLASTKNAPVQASNSGIVAFSDYLGIYGNTVIIDHGLGLFSFYAHLGMTTVKKGQNVQKGELIGRSDTSGLAGGDHLHFGIFVGNRFVNPQEWWDPHWIRDNVERKMNVTF